MFSAIMSRFLSTPSGWRATEEIKAWLAAFNISIHALRVEGDGLNVSDTFPAVFISIHALRVEGDTKGVQDVTKNK